MVQGRVDFVPFHMMIGTLQQDFTASENSGLCDFDPLEKSPAVGFLQDGFVFPLPLGQGPWGAEEKNLWDAIGHLLTRDATGSECAIVRRKPEDVCPLAYSHSYAAEPESGWGRPDEQLPGR